MTNDAVPAGAPAPDSGGAPAGEPADSDRTPAAAAAAAPALGPFTRIIHVLEMIKVQHTVFALPFALMAALTAAHGWHAIAWRTIGLIVVAVLGARSAAMAFNRLADADHDAVNPRTARRHIPAGILSRGFTAWFIVLSLAVFGLAAALLNPLCLAGAPIVAGLLLGYSYTKRFTWLCHVWLGASLGLAPIGAWAAMRGNFAPLAGGVSAGMGSPVDLFPFVLGLAVLFWTAGFDVLYACQDFEHDRATPGLYSAPKRFGLAGALTLARSMHCIAAALLVAATLVGGFGAAVWVGLAIAGALLIYQHWLVRPDDLTRIEAAFFLVNGAISLILFAAVTVQFALA